jgi:hypothetical protein
MDASHADMLGLSVTPGILISACGVVSSALYNRLGVILARIRSYHQRKIDLLVGPPRHDAVDPQALLGLLGLLDAQVAAVTAKARMVQKGLYYLLAAIVAFLLCAVCAGVATLYDWVGPVALASGLVGVCLFVAGLGWAVREVTCALSPLEEETAYLQALTSQQSVKSQERTKLKIAE